MRFLHIIPGMANSSGPTQALINLATHQANLGHQVCIAHLTGRGSDGDALEHPGVERRGFPVRHLRHWGYSPSLMRFLETQVSSFDMVHVHSLWLYPNLAASQACRRHRVPYIVRAAGSLEPWCMGAKQLKKELYWRFIERGILNHAAAVHAVSEQEARNINGFGLRAPTVTIPNGIDLKQYSDIPSKAAARQMLGLHPDAPLILFLSRIHFKKGLDILGQAFRRVRERLPGAALAIVGPDDHDYARCVKALYRDMGFDGGVAFLGEKRGAEKIAAYAAADVFVLPSRSENFGIVVAESLAAGTPVVVSNTTPWSQVEQAGAGYWVELNDEIFAERILEILRDGERARGMGRLGRQMIFENFSWDTIARRTVESYQSLLQSGR